MFVVGRGRCVGATVGATVGVGLGDGDGVGEGLGDGVSGAIVAVGDGLGRATGCSGVVSAKAAPITSTSATAAPLASFTRDGISNRVGRSPYRPGVVRVLVRSFRAGRI